jgi:hypothetical protein
VAHFPPARSYRSRPTLCRHDSGRGHVGDPAFRQLALYRGALPCRGNRASVGPRRSANHGELVGWARRRDQNLPYGGVIGNHFCVRPPRRAVGAPRQWLTAVPAHPWTFDSTEVGISVDFLGLAVAARLIWPPCPPRDDFWGPLVHLSACPPRLSRWTVPTPRPTSLATLPMPFADAASKKERSAQVQAFHW